MRIIQASQVTNEEVQDDTTEVGIGADVEGVYPALKDMEVVNICYQAWWPGRDGQDWGDGHDEHPPVRMGWKNIPPEKGQPDWLLCNVLCSTNHHAQLGWKRKRALSENFKVASLNPGGARVLLNCSEDLEDKVRLWIGLRRRFPTSHLEWNLLQHL